MHVTHNTKPFVNRVRYAPEVASRPDRLQKDLESAKALAAVLEDEAAKLRQFKPEKPRKPEGEADGDVEVKEEDGDAAMAEVEAIEEEEPAERGSDAVERKVAKLMDEFVQQGLLEPADQKAYVAKKVSIVCPRSSHYHYLFRIIPFHDLFERTKPIACCLTTVFATDGSCIGPVPRLPSCCVPHMLLLCGRDGSR